jgi:hypothetical protein
MGGKGIRRREKNYRAAHGGSHSLLPPPPKSSQVDALPSKLRKLISLTSQLHDGTPFLSTPSFTSQSLSLFPPFFVFLLTRFFLFFLDTAKNSMSGQENTKQEVGDAKKVSASFELLRN